MDQKSWPAPAADAPKPLIYMAEKDWKKDWGLNPPVFPLAGLMLLIRSHPVRPPCVRVGARGGPEGRMSVIV